MSIELISAIGVFIGFILLTIGAWKKVNLIILTLVVSAIIALFGGLDVGKVWANEYSRFC